MKRLSTWLLSFVLLAGTPSLAAPRLQYDGKYVEVRFEGQKRIALDRSLEVLVDSAPRKPWSATLNVYDAHHQLLQTYPVNTAYLSRNTAVYLGDGSPPLVLVLEGPFTPLGPRASDTPLLGHIVMDGVAGPLTVQGTWHTGPRVVAPPQ